MVRFVNIGGIVDHHCLSFLATNIMITNHHLSPKESLNSDCQQFHQYQDNEPSPLTSRKLKQ
jgi:hypothetical protein